jgi:hypothetical protein
MASTYELINSSTLTTSAFGVTFSSIPTTFTDLMLRISARTDVGSNQDTVKLRFNNDTNTNYGRNTLFGGGSGGVGSNNNLTTRILAPYVNGSTAQSDTFGAIDFYIPSYRRSQYKELSAFGASENDNNLAYMGITAGLYTDTTPISTVTVEPENGGSFLSGSSFYLYGISNA